MQKNPYNVLGIDPDASEDEIKKRYRALVKKYHPDLHPNDPVAAEKMAEINEAYEMIRSGYSESYAANESGSGNDYDFDPESFTSTRSYSENEKKKGSGDFTSGFIHGIMNMIRRCLRGNETKAVIIIFVSIAACFMSVFGASYNIKMKQNEAFRAESKFIMSNQRAFNDFSRYVISLSESGELYGEINTNNFPQEFEGDKSIILKYFTSIDTGINKDGYRYVSFNGSLYGKHTLLLYIEKTGTDLSISKDRIPISTNMVLYTWDSKKPLTIR